MVAAPASFAGTSGNYSIFVSASTPSSPCNRQLVRPFYLLCVIFEDSWNRQLDVLVRTLRHRDFYVKRPIAAERVDRSGDVCSLRSEPIRQAAGNP